MRDEKRQLWYTSHDAYIGATLNVAGRSWLLVDADPYTLQYMENTGHPMADFGAAREELKRLLQGRVQTRLERRRLSQRRSDPKNIRCRLCRCCQRRSLQGGFDAARAVHRARLARRSGGRRRGAGAGTGGSSCRDALPPPGSPGVEDRGAAERARCWRVETSCCSALVCPLCPLAALLACKRRGHHTAHVSPWRALNINSGKDREHGGKRGCRPHHRWLWVFAKKRCNAQHTQSAHTPRREGPPFHRRAANRARGPPDDTRLHGRKLHSSTQSTLEPDTRINDASASRACERR